MRSETKMTRFAKLKTRPRVCDAASRELRKTLIVHADNRDLSEDRIREEMEYHF